MSLFVGLAYAMISSPEATFLKFSSRNSIVPVLQILNSVFVVFKFQADVTIQMCAYLVTPSVL